MARYVEMSTVQMTIAATSAVVVTVGLLLTVMYVTIDELSLIHI